MEHGCDMLKTSSHPEAIAGTVADRVASREVRDVEPKPGRVDPLTTAMNESKM